MRRQRARISPNFVELPMADQKLLDDLHASWLAHKPCHFQQRRPTIMGSADDVAHLPEGVKTFIVAHGKLQRCVWVLQTAPPIIQYRACWGLTEHDPEWLDVQL